jgi:large subunit ribosomal protein L6
MSRIGRQPIPIPSQVTVSIDRAEVVVAGPKGKLSQIIRPEIKVSQENGQLIVTNTSSSNSSRALHGLYRSLLSNMVVGVTDGWSKTLEISGTGYRASIAGKVLTLNLGFSHPVIVEAPSEITFEVKENKIVVSGIDKTLVGETAAKIRKIKRPDPYKAKGIKYQDEKILRKAGKAAKAGGATK